MLNSYGFGGYMILSGYKTFIDGRSELFEQTGILDDYMHITLLKPGAMQVLNGYHVRSCLMQRVEPLSTALAAMPDWQTVILGPSERNFRQARCIAGFHASGNWYRCGEHEVTDAGNDLHRRAVLQ